MVVKFTNIVPTIKELRKAIVESEVQADKTTDHAALIIMEEFFKRTPVWSGETIRNYAWGKGKKASGSPKGAIGSGPPGPTGSMAMGAEPRRPANEAAVMSELQGLIADPKLGDMHLTNLVRADKWDLVDNGSAPTPDRARNPGGVTKIAMQIARARIQGEFK